ncbi:translation repressor protein [Morganella phage vB_Mm5]
MIEIKLKNDDCFLKIKETLTRIGIASNKSKTLWQSCHILTKQGKCYIVHFKEMLALDGRETNITEEDKTRTKDIAKLLEQWKLCDIVDRKQVDGESENSFRILTYAQKPEWNLQCKYRVGNI